MKRMVLKRIGILVLLTLLFICIFSANKIVNAEYLGYNEFIKKPDMFCLNKGYAFHSGDYEEVARGEIKNNRLTLNGRLPDNYHVEKLRREEFYIPLAYILSEIEGDRNSIAGSIYQQAIWYLLSEHAISSDEAKQVYANAQAYYSYGSNTGKKPVIENTSVTIRNGLLGPFKLKYEFTEGRFIARIGYYGEINKITLDGAEIETNSIYYKMGDGSYKSTEDLTDNEEIENTFKNYPKSGKEFYIKVDSSKETYTLGVSQNSGYRNANFNIYHSNSTVNVYYYNGEGFRAQITVRNGEYFCLECMRQLSKSFIDRATCLGCGNINTNDENYCGVCDSFSPILGSGSYICPNLHSDSSHSNYAIVLEPNSKSVFFYTRSGTPGRYSLVHTDDINLQSAAINLQNILIGEGEGNDPYESRTFTLYPKLELTLEKQNTVGENLTGAEFSILAKQGNETIFSREGVLVGEKISITPNNTSNITVRIEETSEPNGHFLTGTPIIIEYRYNASARKWEIETITGGWNSLGNGEYGLGKDKFKIVAGTPSETASPYTITIYNRPKVSVDFSKIDKLTGEGIAGIIFNVDILNIGEGLSSLTGIPEIVNNSINFNIATLNDGTIPLDDMEFVVNTSGNGYEDIIITLKEMEVITGNANYVDEGKLAKYRFLHDDIKLVLRYGVNNGEALITIECEYDAQDDVQYTSNLNDFSVNVEAKDEPIIHLSGKVWLDIPQGEKPANVPDGVIQTNEEGIGGIRVYLFKVVDGVGSEVRQDTYGYRLMEKTANGGETQEYIGSRRSEDGVLEIISESLGQGEYFFHNLPKLKQGDYYYIYYSYDGVNYIATIAGNNQDANEATNIRESFNGKFNTITANKIITSYYALVNGEIQTLMSGGSLIGRPTSGSNGRTLEYETNYHNMYGRYISELKTVDENGNVFREYTMFSRTNNNYTETQGNIDLGLQKRELDLSLMNDVYEAEVSINGKTTIYTYDDIINAGGTIEIEATTGDENSYDKGKYELKLYKSDYDYNEEELAIGTGGRTSSNELQVYITYAISLNNQGIINLYEQGLTASINSIIDYYDSNYTFISATTIEGERLTATNGRDTTIEGKTYKQVIIEGIGDKQLIEGGRNIIYLRFRVNGAGDTINLGEYNNIAEIISYTTSDGLVDKDSAPYNAVSVSSLQYEDDTDNAMGINITVPGNPGDPNKPRTRIINGNVWEDIKNQSNGDYKYGNGIIDSGEQRLSNITVQLIEITSEGKEKEVETTTTSSRGTYSFSGFIPGDYIVRFIYKGQDYNGQNYKSTTISETHYNNELNNENNWYYNNLYTQFDGGNTSKAIDKATRRLELMSEYAQITKETAQQLETGANLEMIANTPKIYVSIDTDNFNDTEKPSNVNDGNNPVDINIRGVNLGIERRAETKIVLEEHIKRLMLKGNDNISLVQAEVETGKLFDNRITNYTSHLEGIIQGLTAWKTTRTTFGTWEIQTDIGELLQGAQLETEAIYQVKNEGEVDYLSKDLITAYTELPIEGYKEHLKEITDNRTALGKIGKTYFTGRIDRTVEKVPTKIEAVRDYINYFEYKKGDFNEIAAEVGGYNVLATDGRLTKEKVETVIQTGETKALLPNERYEFSAVLGRNGLTATGRLEYENYIAQIMSYSNAVGRKDEEAIPGNLEDKYIYSYDKEVTLEQNERDEYSAERIEIKQSTGEDKETMRIIIISILAGIAIIAVGIIFIKKHVV